MLYVYTADPETFEHLVGPTRYFNLHYDIEKDFNDKVSQYIIEKSNGCKILMPGVIRTRYGLTTLENLCGGTKTLLVAWKEQDKIVPFYSAGDDIICCALDVCDKFNVDLHINIDRMVRTKFGEATFVLNDKLCKTDDFDREIRISRLDFMSNHPELYPLE